MAKSVVEIVISITLIWVAIWLSGCLPPPGNHGGNQAPVTKAEAYNAAEDQWLADWQMRDRIQDLELRENDDE